MPCFESPECNTRLQSVESEADPIGDLCPVCGSRLEPVGDLGDIVGYRVVESRAGRSRSGAWRVGPMIGGRVGEISGRRELKHARVRLEIEAAALTLSGPQVQAVSSRALGTGDDAMRRRRAPTTVEPPRVPCVLQALTTGVIGADGAARRKFALRPRPRFGWRAAKWDRPRATKTTTTSESGADANITIDVFLGRQATHRHEPV